MIIGQFGSLDAAYNLKRPRRKTFCKRKYAQCLRAETASGTPVYRARIVCTQRIRDCMRASRLRVNRRFAGSLGESLDPATLMIAGLVRPWRGKDPRYALTNVSRTAYTATHPLL